MYASPTAIQAAELHRRDVVTLAMRERQIAHALAAPFLVARYPVLTDSRLIALAIALVLALVSFVASGDPAAAGGALIVGGPRHGG